MNNYSFYLFARPSFIEGIARIFDFCGVLNEYNTALTGEQADRLALRADRLALKEDYRIALNKAMDEYGRSKRPASACKK